MLRGSSWFYAAYQEPHESVPQFNKAIYETTTREKLKDTFLTALRELLRTTLVIQDFEANTLERVIDRVFDMDRAQNGNAISMGALQRALLNVEGGRLEVPVSAKEAITQKRKKGEREKEW